ncbi:MAG: hypothetical protein NZ602_10530 [Thermoguttaceae bacterium]|nr:hypothetical protein [Thermoguttaceae bacterium]MDW8037864.1 hypothetical protein [Thermoguttaceae bacterium]
MPQRIHVNPTLTTILSVCPQIGLFLWTIFLGVGGAILVSSRLEAQTTGSEGTTGPGIQWGLTPAEAALASGSASSSGGAGSPAALPSSGGVATGGAAPSGAGTRSEVPSSSNPASNSLPPNAGSGAQAPPPFHSGSPFGAAVPSGGTASGLAEGQPTPGGGAPPSPAEQPRAPIARILPAPATLPNEAGQIWREYDISPYTLRVHTTARPELALIDWILRETGYQAWHSEPLGILSVTQRTLRVYHTPQMQAVVAEIVDRFVNAAAQTQSFGLRVITVDHPNWRAKSYRVLRRVPVQTPGVQAWVLPREDAALLLADLRRRSDYREHNSPHLLIPNGQSTVVSSMRQRSYVRDVTLRPDTLQGYEQELAQIDEGFSIEFSPLLSLDGKMIDASIKCHIDMVERLVPVVIDVPTPTSPRQRVQIEVPQVSHFRFHERFRWPENEVLVLGLGVVPIPAPSEAQGLLPGLPFKLPGQTSSRGELIVMVESRGKQGEPSAPAPTATRPTYQGRY